MLLENMNNMFQYGLNFGSDVNPSKVNLLIHMWTDCLLRKRLMYLIVFKWPFISRSRGGMEDTWARLDSLDGSVDLREPGRYQRGLTLLHAWTLVLGFSPEVLGGGKLCSEAWTFWQKCCAAWLRSRTGCLHWRPNGIKLTRRWIQH